MTLKKTFWIKMLFFTTLLFVLQSCIKKENEAITKYYKASKGDSIGYLTLVLTKHHFKGEYEIRYGRLGKDSGAVRGKRIGDTLKGDFCYRSYGGGIIRKPFVLLTDKENLKLGSGVIATYLTIPFYVKGTLEFNDSDFLFSRIEKEKLRK